MGDRLEAECRVARVELTRGLEEAEDLAVLGVGRHSVPGSWRELRRDVPDDGMESFGDGAIGFVHLGDFLQNVGLVLSALDPPDVRRAAFFSSSPRSFIAARSSSVKQSYVLAFFVSLIPDSYLRRNVMRTSPTVRAGQRQLLLEN